MDYISRSTRNKKETKNIGRGVFVVVASLTMILFVVLSIANKGCSCGLLSSIFGNDKQKENERISEAISQQEDNLASASPSATPFKSGSDQLKLEQRVYYILQMGQYTDPKQANEQSVLIRPMGAAGYVYADDSVKRVFAAIYTEEKDFQKVLEQVRTDGYEASAFLLTSDELVIDVVGDTAQNANIIDAISMSVEIQDQLAEIALNFDKGELSATQCKNRISGLHERLNTALDKITLNSTDNIKKITEYLSDQCEILSTFRTIDDTISEGEISSAVKQLQIRTIIRYIDFIRNIDTSEPSKES